MKPKTEAEFVVWMIKMRMKSEGINQSELARRLGISRQAVSVALNNPANFTIETLEKYADVLGCRLCLGIRDKSHP